MNNQKYTRSNLCQMKDLSCCGCCGHDFGTREKLTIAIKKNTLEYNHAKDIKEWMNRQSLLRECGICTNLIFTGECSVGCPLHPKYPGNKTGKDLRKGHCDIFHLCKTAFIFNLWNKKKQNAFLKFVKDQKPDWYTYSVKMDNDEYLKEFEKFYKD